MQARKIQLKIVKKLTKEQIDLAYVMIKNTYWGASKSRSDFDTQNKHTYLYCILKNKSPIGFFRVVTDGVNLIYLMGLVIEENLRNQGIGSLALNWLKNKFPSMKILMLSTKAQKFYLKNDFKAINESFNYFLYQPG